MPSAAPYYNPNEPEPLPLCERRRAFLAVVPSLCPASVTDLRELLPLAQQLRVAPSTMLPVAAILSQPEYDQLRAPLAQWAERWRLTEDWALADALHTLSAWARSGVTDAFVHWEARYTLQPRLLRRMHRLAPAVTLTTITGDAVDVIRPAIEPYRRAQRAELDNARHEFNLWSEFHPQTETQTAAAARVRRLHEEYRDREITARGLVQTPRDIDPTHLEWLIHFHVGERPLREIARMYGRTQKGDGDTIGRAVRSAASVRVGSRDTRWIELRSGDGPGRPRVE